MPLAVVINNRCNDAPHVGEEHAAAPDAGCPLHFYGVGRAEALARVGCIPQKAGDPRRALRVVDPQTGATVDTPEPIPAGWNILARLHEIGGNLSSNVRRGRDGSFESPARLPRFTQLFVTFSECGN